MYQYILETAQALIGEVGEGFTMEQLEAKVGVSRATIYRRVGNKEALLKHLAQERGETFDKPTIRMSILTAARAVFGKEGLAAATMEQVAVEAKVGVATVYRHFGHKEGLLHAFIREMTPLTTVRAMVLRPTEDVATDLEAIVKPTLVFFFANRDIFRLVILGSETERRYLDSLRERSDSTLGRLSEYLGAQIESGRLKPAGQPDELALALMGMVLAFAVIGPLHYQTELEDPAQSAKLIVNLFLGNLLPGSQPNNDQLQNDQLKNDQRGAQL